jgi:aspartyl-tRNA synthetase
MIEKDPKARVWAIPAPGGGSRAFCDRMNKWAIEEHKQPGLGYIFWRNAGAAQQADPSEIKKAAKAPLEHTPTLTILEAAGPIAKNLGPERAEKLRLQLSVGDGDAVFFAAGNPEKFYKFAGEARAKIGTELKLIKEDQFAFAWIVDFPMYEWNEEEKKIDFSHNPFSMPQGELAALEAAKSQEELLAIKAYQYDIVCNGFEIASGGIRNHKPEAMVKAFEIAGYGEKDVVERFGGMYRAFQYGAPPHGGMAAGVDRIVMLLCGTTNLREISLFPMNQQAMDLLMGAPSDVAPKQLRELHIRLNLPDKA